MRDVLGSGQLRIFPQGHNSIGACISGGNGIRQRSISLGHAIGVCHSGNGVTSRHNGAAVSFAQLQAIFQILRDIVVERTAGDGNRIFGALRCRNLFFEFTAGDGQGILVDVAALGLHLTVERAAGNGGLASTRILRILNNKVLLNGAVDHVDGAAVVHIDAPLVGVVHVQIGGSHLGTAAIHHDAIDGAALNSDVVQLDAASSIPDVDAALGRITRTGKRSSIPAAVQVLQGNAAGGNVDHVVFAGVCLGTSPRLVSIKTFLIGCNGIQSLPIQGNRLVDYDGSAVRLGTLGHCNHNIPQQLDGVASFGSVDGVLQVGVSALDHSAGNHLRHGGASRRGITIPQNDGGQMLDLESHRVLALQSLGHGQRLHILNLVTAPGHIPGLQIGEGALRLRHRNGYGAVVASAVGEQVGGARLGRHGVGGQDARIRIFRDLDGDILRRTSHLAQRVAVKLHAARVGLDGQAAGLAQRIGGILRHVQGGGFSAGAFIGGCQVDRHAVVNDTSLITHIFVSFIRHRTAGDKGAVQTAGDTAAGFIITAVDHHFAVADLRYRIIPIGIHIALVAVGHIVADVRREGTASDGEINVVFAVCFNKESIFFSSQLTATDIYCTITVFCGNIHRSGILTAGTISPITSIPGSLAGNQGFITDIQGTALDTDTTGFSIDRSTSNVGRTGLRQIDRKICSGDQLATANINNGILRAVITVAGNRIPASLNLTTGHGKVTAVPHGNTKLTISGSIFKCRFNTATGQRK